MKDPRENFELADIFSPIENHPSFFCKKMFGGLSVYYNGFMIGCLTESPDEYQYRGVQYDHPIWYGLLLPTDYAHHQSLLKDFPLLQQHPVLKKWLYLPMKDDEANFRKEARKIILKIVKGDLRFGIEPKARKKRKKSR